MANASLLIPSISAVLSILVVFFPCVAWEDTAASCCSCPFEQLPAGRGITHPPTARILLGAGAVTTTIFQANVEEWGKREGRKLSIKKCNGKAWGDPRRKEKRKKLTESPHLSPLLFVLFLFSHQCFSSFPSPPASQPLLLPPWLHFPPSLWSNSAAFVPEPVSLSPEGHILSTWLAAGSI